MPTYGYRCPRCGEFEEHQSILDEALKACPLCGSAVQRIITGGSGFIVKGGGATEPVTRRSCERDTPCCGRATRCDKPPCGE